ncbi:hypothetical protein K402DRAFT_332883 [Aulographum hederae CBS 113979]|uniref:F-box domain-containing protein n=1 Tax=Aulographum hederae CBS 113979 TaxID=1176131 RepID=A0A6G1GZT2_9PEZI|nr:hypothetical protein K402DRAFT_332883 [Aulographum hederae CBS 113979]
MQISPAPQYPDANGYSRKELPLNLVVLILEYLDNAADLANLVRTSRLLYYMTLPRLYEKVTLRSYAELRYRDGVPEGCGSGSPFSMGLNGLATSNVGAYTRELRLAGNWKENDSDEFTKGRVPDSTVMLSIVARVAIDKMNLLTKFSWELDTKPMYTVYQGLAVRPNLTSLRIRFPTIRIPRPVTSIPPFPDLKSLKLYDIDPLCYPDDISLLLLHSKKLEDLALDWNPRMRDEGEPSIHLHSLFGKCIRANYKLQLKSLALANLYTPNYDEFEAVVSPSALHSLTFINSISRDPMTVFFDDAWRRRKHLPEDQRHWKFFRSDGIDRESAAMLAQLSGLEELYLVNVRRPSSKQSPRNLNVNNANSPSTRSPSSVASPITPSTNGAAAAMASHQATPTANASLAAEYLAAITTQHSANMRSLLLHEDWQLNEDAALHLLRACPNLEQLGLAVGGDAHVLLRKLMAAGPKLWAIKLLMKPVGPLYEVMQEAGEENHRKVLSYEFCKNMYRRLKWFGMAGMIFEVGGLVEVERKTPMPTPGSGSGSGEAEASAGANAAGTGEEGIDIGEKMDTSTVEDVENGEAGGEGSNRSNSTGKEQQQQPQELDWTVTYGEKSYVRRVRFATWEEARHVSIFGMDSLEI